MIATSPEKVFLRILWDIVRENGRPPQVRLEEIAKRVQALQKRGVTVYPTRTPAAITRSMRSDAQLLARMGLLELSDDTATLTGAGELIGASVRLPR